MSKQLSKEEQKIIGIVIAAMMIIATAIIISRQLFPFFLGGSILLFVIFSIVLIREMFFIHEGYLSSGDYLSKYIGIAFLVFLGGTILTWFIGYGIGGTPLGQASLEVYYGFTGFEQELEDSIDEIVEESCKSLSEENCALLRSTARTAKTMKEVKDFAGKLKKGKKVPEKFE
ncbi:hypothetical protein JYT91_00650 [archaeon AH-315-M20]|nr:hypothetical protein [archaeon AH-315-M20]